MAAIKEYKCPWCGGAVEFDSKIQKIKCPYCDTEFDTEAFTAHEEEVQNAKPDEMEWETTAGSAWEQGEESTLRSYVCNSCGGEIVCDENTAATSCPYCGNPVVMMGQVSGAALSTLLSAKITSAHLEGGAESESCRARGV